MHVYLIDHFIFLLASFLCGVLLSVVYDIIRIFRIFRGDRFNIPFLSVNKFLSCSFFRFYENSRKSNRHPYLNYLLIFIEDILFCLITCTMLLILIYAFNYGRVRLFSLLALVLGFLLWRVISSWTVFFVLQVVVYVIRVILFYFFYPLIILLKKIKKVIYKPCIILYNTLREKFTVKKTNEINSKSRKKTLSVNNVYVVKK